MKNHYFVLVCLCVLSSCSVKQMLFNDLGVNVEKVLAADSIYVLKYNQEIDELVKISYEIQVEEQSADTLKFVSIHGATKNIDEYHFKNLYNNIISNFDGHLKVKFVESREFPSRVPGLNPLILNIWESKSNLSKPILFYDLQWVNVSSQFKENLIKYDDDPLRYHNAKVLKEELVIDYLGDMALYMNPKFKIELLNLSSRAISSIHLETGTQLNFITGSLGSKVAYDLLTYSNIDPPLDMTSVRTVFFLSNQLPFLNIESYPDDIDNFEMFLNHITQDLSDKTSKLGHQIEVISFFDPDDMLGYPIPDLTDSDYLKILNVEIKNNNVWSLSPERLRQKNINFKELGLDEDLLWQSLNEKGRLELMLKLKSPNQDAKNSEAIARYIASKYIVTQEPLHNKDTIAGYKIDKASCFDKRAKKGKKQHKLLFQLIAGSYLLKQKSKLSFHSDVPRIQHPVAYSYSPGYQKTKFDFDGIAECLEQSDTATVITYHGMKAKTPEHFDEMADVIASNFKMYLTRKELVTNSRTRALSGSYGNFNVFKRTYGNGEGKSLIVYIIHWSPFTANIKNHLFRLNEIESNRSASTKLVKDQLMIDGMVDIISTIKSDSTQLYKQLDNSFRSILTDENGNGKNVFVISSSLGSSVLYEYLLNTHKSQGEVSIQIKLLVAERLSKVFMLSNQLPLIHLKNFKDFNCTAGEFVNGTYDWDQTMPQMDIVAFNDPNDLLSFRLKQPSESSLTVSTTQMNIGKGQKISIKGVKSIAEKIECQMRGVINKNELTGMVSKYLDTGETYGEFTIDFGSAHSGVSSYRPLLDMISYGTDSNVRYSY